MQTGSSDRPSRRLGPLRAPRGLARRLGEAAMAALLVLLVVTLVDFARFVGSIEAREPSALAASDGLVALTGGAERIADALDLMAGHRARRMLITGVHANTGVATLTAAAPRYRELFACCVDIDRNALNTLGNALETVRWARANAFHSLIVVTSSYHMPRAMLELSRLAPEITLTPYPVVASGLDIENWWRDGQMRRVILGEYVKFVIARVNLRLDPATSAPVAQARLEPPGAAP